jgi:hypothetical protein
MAAHVIPIQVPETNNQTHFLSKVILKGIENKNTVFSFTI